MVFTYSDKIAKDKYLMEQINKEANLVPHTGEISKSNKINSVQAKIVSSITKNFIHLLCSLIYLDYNSLPTINLTFSTNIDILYVKGFILKLEECV